MKTSRDGIWPDTRIHRKKSHKVTQNDRSIVQQKPIKTGSKTHWKCLSSSYAFLHANKRPWND